MPGSVTQFTALYDINLTVEDGEFFGIIGHTGSGKSTFRISPVTAGSG